MSEFIWSKSVDNTFRKCKRKFYYDKYGFLKDDKIRVLKKLRRAHTWVGEIVHAKIKDILIALKNGKLLPINIVLMSIEATMKEGFYESERGVYKKPDMIKSNCCALFEHEYNMGLSEVQLNLLITRAKQCIKNFYNSQLFKFIQDVKPEDWLPIDNREYINFYDTKICSKIDFGIKKDNKILIFDWKTGKGAPNKIQLGIYAFFFSKKFNIDINNILTKEYNLILDTTQTFKFSSSTEIEDYIKSSIDSITSLLYDKEKNIAREEDFPRVNDHNKCRWCKFKRVCYGDAGI